MHLTQSFHSTRLPIPNVNKRTGSEYLLTIFTRRNERPFAPRAKKAHCVGSCPEFRTRAGVAVPGDFVGTSLLDPPVKGVRKVPPGARFL